jgi:hypothetical protein
MEPHGVVEGAKNEPEVHPAETAPMVSNHVKCKSWEESVMPACAQLVRAVSRPLSKNLSSSCTRKVLHIGYRFQRSWKALFSLARGAKGQGWH